jgi:hypothetical protein
MGVMSKTVRSPQQFTIVGGDGTIFATLEAAQASSERSKRKLLVGLVVDVHAALRALGAAPRAEPAGELARLLPGLTRSILAVQNEDDGEEHYDHRRNVARAAELLLAERNRLALALVEAADTIDAERARQAQEIVTLRARVTWLEEEHEAAQGTVETLHARAAPLALRIASPAPPGEVFR